MSIYDIITIEAKLTSF